MKSLVQYITESLVLEAHFNKNEFAKHDFKYAIGVLTDLVNGEAVKLGAEASSTTSATLDDDKIDDAKKLLGILKELNASGKMPNDATIESYRNRFDSLFDDKSIVWTKIFKGKYSGYVAGIDSKNRGNAFEGQFVSNFADYEDDLRKLVDIGNNPQLSRDGGANTRRPIKFTNDGFTIGDHLDIGKDVTDVTVNKDTDNPVYLSLKYGPAVTLANAGIQKYIDKGFIEKGDTPNKQTQIILDTLHLDAERVRDVFVKYIKPEKKHKAEKAKEELDGDLSSLISLCQSAMGYGYILVHKTSKGDVHFYDIRTKKDLEQYISKGVLRKAYAAYPVGGSAKRVEVNLEFDKIIINIVLRAKDGGIYPTHLLFDYTLK